MAVFGAAGDVWSWGRNTFEKRESGLLQPIAVVVLMSYRIASGRTESKEGRERMQETLDRIERRIKRLE